MIGIETNRKSSRVLLWITLAVVLVLYGAYANYAYNRVLPQSRPCVDCATPAHINGYDLYYRELGTDKVSEAESYLEEPLRLLLHLIMSLPEYQLG